MYIKSIQLEDIRCFKKIKLDVSSKGGSLLLLGDNGDGKSTFLKCLAMGLCDESSASALFRELSGEYVRRKNDEKEVPIGRDGFITIELDVGGGTTYVISTIITSSSSFEHVRQNVTMVKGSKTKNLEQIDFDWSRLFVVGYGPGLRTQASGDYQHYLAVDAVYPLFSYSTPLQNPHQVIMKLLYAARSLGKDAKQKFINENKTKKNIQALMSDLLGLNSPDDFIITPTTIKLRGHWGTSEEAELGDGFRSTINWILDLVSWWFIRASANNSNWIDSFNLDDIIGIVIIDEIEQHLHPKWQKRIYSQIRKKFKNVQFVVSTHSPLVASSNDNVDVHVFEKGMHRTIVPYGWLAEDLYEEMGLQSSRSAEFVNNVINKYKELLRKAEEQDITTDEKQELNSLRKRFSVLPESDPVGLVLELKAMTDKLRDKV